MSLTGVSPYCLPCERYDHWIEIIIRDEHNQPFPNIKGVLFDGSGSPHPVVLGEEPILLVALAPGRVSIRFDNELWLNETQKRLPFEGTQSPVEQWICDNPTGHESCSRTPQTLTLGDFVDLDDEQELPPRHQAGARDVANLVTDRSHFITIQGCRYITLRLGMFFDGTANNTYSAKWGKQQLDNYYQTWNSHYTVSKERTKKSSAINPAELLEGCFQLPDTMINANSVSAGNELTNVQKLFDLYKQNEFNVEKTIFHHAQYITGIGTGNSTEIAPADEDATWGLGMGINKYGVEAKVKTGIEQICSQLEGIVSTIRNEMTLDGIRKLEFDVFGFSRGAAAARHFINVILDGEPGLFAQEFIKASKELEVFLSNNYDWTSNNCCLIQFAGLFDTVAAIANPLNLDVSAHDGKNDPIRLWLDPTRVSKAVHLVANSKTEYRYNFSVNLLNKAAHFDEIVVPGAHSDIGGGYHSHIAFKQADFLLPLLENTLVKSVTDNNLPMFNNQSHVNTLRNKLEQARDFDVSHGWSSDNYLITEPQFTSSGKEQRAVSMDLYYRQKTEGDLSRLYLRMMYGLAEHAGVPVKDNVGDSLCWTATLPPFSLYYPVPKTLTNRVSNSSFSFSELCDQVLQMAKAGHVDELKLQFGSERALTTFMDLELIHHSSDETVSGGVVKPFKPNEIKGRYLRQEHQCETT